MTYIILGQSLHDVADRAKSYFAQHYGAKGFKCETSIDDGLPLKPTWLATLSTGYYVGIEVRETPFSNSLYEFVSKSATRALPIQLWVAVPPTAAAPTFNAELKQARECGIGVAQINDDGSVHEFHRPVPLSLFGLKKTTLESVPKNRREEVKNAESTFLDGSPGQGCQAISQSLEELTRIFAEHTYSKGLWKHPAGTPALKARFFHTDSWATMLETMEVRIDVGKIKAKVPTFSKQSIVKARGHTDWRNAVSHQPTNFKQRKERDAKLRTMFESTRDLLIEWYEIAKPFKLIK
ncbi:hypothetical protein [Peristeroidobacter soli]|uniref:hypothetical protein n=1 Tax=Peristeroidobacter soli TaxID=2497877 RepID=UPI00101CED3A|nr:hypothetical protein [Peristeroidobacter soli]